MKVFISRELQPDSPFRSLLSAQNISVFAQSLLHIEPIVVQDWPQADIWFFYSKTGLNYFIAQAPAEQWSRKIACLGAATASGLEHTGRKADFIGTGEPQTTAGLFAQFAAGQKVGFVQAQNSMQSLQKLLAGQIQGFSLPIYHNEARATLPDYEADVLVFTSPMNAEAYFSQKPFLKQKVVAIGQTTAQKLQNLGVNEVFTPKEPNETGLAGLVLDIYANFFGKDAHNSNKKF